MGVYSQAVPARVLNSPLRPPARALFITSVKLAPGDSATGSSAGIKPRRFISIGLDSKLRFAVLPVKALRDTAVIFNTCGFFESYQQAPSITRM